MLKYIYLSVITVLFSLSAIAYGSEVLTRAGSFLSPSDKSTGFMCLDDSGVILQHSVHPHLIGAVISPYALLDGASASHQTAASGFNKIQRSLIVVFNLILHNGRYISDTDDLYGEVRQKMKDDFAKLGGKTLLCEDELSLPEDLSRKDYQDAYRRIMFYLGEDLKRIFELEDFSNFPTERELLEWIKRWKEYTKDVDIPSGQIDHILPKSQAGRGACHNAMNIPARVNLKKSDHVLFDTITALQGEFSDEIKRNAYLKRIYQESRATKSKKSKRTRRRLDVEENDASLGNLGQASQSARSKRSKLLI